MSDNVRATRELYIVKGSKKWVVGQFDVEAALRRHLAS
jgi:hypothetical protein